MFFEIFTAMVFPEGNHFFFFLGVVVGREEEVRKGLILEGSHPARCFRGSGTSCHLTAGATFWFLWAMDHTPACVAACLGGVGKTQYTEP